MRFLAVSCLLSLVTTFRHGPVRACAAAGGSGPSPEAWREFRANLIAGGIRVTSDENGGEEVVEAPAVKPREVVAPANEKMLKSQSAVLYDEYLQGAWAHVAPQPEAGGLVVFLPLQSQLVHKMREGEGVSHWSDQLRERLVADVSTVDGDDAGNSPEALERLLAQWVTNTVYTYRLADRLINEVLEVVSQKATNGQLSLSAVTADQRELLQLYIDAQSSWQEVALVLDVQGTGADGGIQKAECVVINRPIARSMSRELATLLLNGSDEARRGIGPLYDNEALERFLLAFGKEAAVYVGGPDAQEQPGALVHGFELPGATEVAPGTRIYTGGVEAAVEGVLAGTYRPLDFRWFVGRRKSVSTSGGAWCPVACSRPLALKQCLGLPKPLWHEVLETCGGEVAELSKIELLKRPDL